MAFPASDSFTGTNGTLLTTYSANWTQTINGSGNTLKINSNAVHNEDTGNGWQPYHWNADQAAIADYDVQAKIIAGASGTKIIGVASRIAGSGANASDCVLAYYDNGTWYLYERHGGTVDLRGSYTGDVPTGAGKICKLSLVGVNATVYIDGVSRITSSAIALSAKGFAGIGGYYVDPDSNARLLDDWQASDPAASDTLFAQAML